MISLSRRSSIACTSPRALAKRLALVPTLLAIVACASTTENSRTGKSSVQDGGHGGADGRLPCTGLPEDQCGALYPSKCQPIRGNPAWAPSRGPSSYLGCLTLPRSPEDPDGGPILPYTAIFCTRAYPGAACYQVGSNFVPDGWELLQCPLVPADCPRPLSDGGDAEAGPSR